MNEYEQTTEDFVAEIARLEKRIAALTARVKELTYDTPTVLAVVDGWAPQNFAYDPWAQAPAFEGMAFTDYSVVNVVDRSHVLLPDPIPVRVVVLARKEDRE